MAKVLLINPPYYETIFKHSKTKSALGRGVLVMWPATIAATLMEKGHEVRFLDLNLEADSGTALDEAIKGFKPDFAGLTCTTPLFATIKMLIERIKAVSEGICVVIGGPHATALPEECLKESKADIAVIGEGDFTMSDIAGRKPLGSINGISYKTSDGRIVTNPKNSFIENLDSLPFPALQIFRINEYAYPAITAKASPVTAIETSRGCFSRCTYCNKNIFGYKFRTKSVKRVIDEMFRAKELGFNEIHIIDDGFTTDMNRADEICDEIIRRKLGLPWYVRGGIRVDRVSYELLSKMRKSGCYRIPFGIETGDPDVLKNIQKGIKLEQAENAVKWAKKAGMITEAYFMIGLPGETEESMRRTLAFAKKLNTDYVKFAITVPLPGTEMFKKLKEENRILTTDWSKYTFASSPECLFTHENLSWQKINEYYRKLHIAYYFRPSYILKMIVMTMIRGVFWGHVKAFFRTGW
ncbi:MAG: cobalamin-dependent protein [Endomicrobiales bacterium]|nr:cobalamin-dependent protein [Endomicrobiales bacterium]